MRAVLEAAESPNTRRAYAAQFRKFTAWCEHRETEALPATPAVVATYLVDLAETGADPSKPPKGCKVATVALALSAISAAHRAAGVEFDVRAREIRSALKGIRRTYAAPQAQAAALKPVMIRASCLPSGTPRSTVATRPSWHSCSPGRFAARKSRCSTMPRPAQAMVASR